MRQRINSRQTTNLVYSTRPEVHQKLCEIHGRRNTLNQPILTSTSIGRQYNATIVCEEVNPSTRIHKDIGRFKGSRNLIRRIMT